MIAYPQHLLPKATYSFIQWRKELGEHCLLRATTERDVIDPSTHQVRLRFVLGDGQSRDVLKDYSTNLAGVFTTEDAAIQITKNDRKAYFIGAWTIGESVDIPEQVDFFQNEPYGYFFYPIDKIADFPYPIRVQTKPMFTQARCYVCHTPTRSNFWHFSVRWKVGLDDIEQALTKNERRDRLEFVRSFLVNNAVSVAPAPNKPIPEAWYK